MQNLITILIQQVLSDSAIYSLLLLPPPPPPTLKTNKPTQNDVCSQTKLAQTCMYSSLQVCCCCSPVAYVQATYKVYLRHGSA